jgi:hypothetical protein
MTVILSVKNELYNDISEIQQFLLLLLPVKYAVDLGSGLCWGKPTIPRL